MVQAQKMTLPFFKYQGAGNDFVLIDNRKRLLRKDQTDLLRQLCDRRFGIGADGVIFLQNHSDFDFEMVYFNADGRESTMCGNGGRCVVAFAKALKIMDNHTVFLAIDGEHEAFLTKPDWVKLKMTDVAAVEQDADGAYILNTGSPHYVRFVDAIEAVDVVTEGRSVRYNRRFEQEGINVNFVQKSNDGLKIATYERGVEDETLACGTGVTAAALSYFLDNQTVTSISVQAKGGDLEVHFEPTEAGGFRNIWLSGAAVKVFEGNIDLSQFNFKA